VTDSPNATTSSVSIVPLTAGIADGDLEALLTEVYVGGGFTEPSAAATMFAASNVRARGEVLVATDAARALVGMVIAVPFDSPARRFANHGEAELQLLAVRPNQQGRGVGSALVTAAMDTARSFGATRMILWTQSSMTVAQRLYAKHEFVRVPSLDFSRGDRQFQVFARAL